MQTSQGHILKVLSGAQTGVEVAMGPGEYSLGSGPDDDLQFVDVSLTPGHARLKIEDGNVFVAGGSGSAKTQTGLDIAVGDEDWQQVEDLDVITIGTTAFALGSPKADWAKVVNYRDTLDTPNPRSEKRLVAPPKAQTERRTHRLVWAGALGLCIFMGASVLLTPLLGSGSQANAVEQRADLDVLQEAFASVPFSHTVTLRQEVDGVIFANGYVDAPVERRALLNAAETTGIPVRMRVFVRSSIRQQIAGLIERQDLPVTFKMTDAGVVTLTGDILDAEQAARFVSRLETDISGISKIDNRLQTADSYLAAVRQLAARSELQEQVLFRLDGQLIEASGIIGPNKLDNYVGFIQSFARRFADHIPLRSLVQLVNENGQVIATAAAGNQGDPIVIGATQTTQGLDLNRLKQGSFNAGYVFDDLEGERPTEETVETTVTEQPDAVVTVTDRADQSAPVANVSSASQDATRRLAGFANDLLEGGSDTKDNGVFNVAALQSILSELKNRWGTQNEDVSFNFLPLVVSPASTSERCWNNSELTLANLPLVLFWLDMLSVTRELDVTDLDVQSQHLLLEAALSPSNTVACAQRLSLMHGAQLKDVSLFLDEIQRNPDFIRFIARNVDAFQLPIAGVMAGSGARYVQVVSGLRLREGASPDPGSKLASVGELGALIRTSDSVSTVIYGKDLAWMSKS